MKPRRQFNPFPGLRPFRMDEKYLFFGREEQTEELLARLREHRFLAVVGTSGSGKSSLVRAGLLPELHGGSMLEAGFQWEVVIMRPGGDPFTQLAEALVAADLYDPDRESSVLETRATLSRSGAGLVEAIRQSDIEEGSSLLLVVDQFEELFRFRGRSAAHLEEAGDFVELLLRAAAQNEVPIYVALTMRSDYLGNCADFPGLAEAVNEGEYLIPRLSREQRRSVIEGPVRVGGGDIAPRLLQTLLNEVGDDPDHLPVLQHALMRTWDLWENDHVEGEPIDLRHYALVGGMAEALSRHADEVYDELPDDRHRQVTERLFKSLTERSGTNPGIRRPGSLNKLCAVCDAEQATVVTVIEAFRRMGRTFLMPLEEVELQPETVIDISHESLMRVWARLASWVEEESQSARIYGRLRETAELHVRGRAGLYHDPDLQIAESWRESAKPNQAWAEQYGGGFGEALGFLDDSRESERKIEDEREATRLREIEQAKALAVQSEQLAESQQRLATHFKRFALGMAIIAVAAIVGFFSAIRAESRADKIAEETRRLKYVSDMTVVRQALDKSNVGRARRILDTHIPKSGDADLRGWEWRYLKSETLGNQFAELGPFERDVLKVDYSADWKWLGIVERGGEFYLWDTEAKSLQSSWNLESSFFAFSPLGSTLAVPDGRGAIRLLDPSVVETNSGSVLPVEGEVMHLDYSPDGGKLGVLVDVGNDTLSAQVWDTERGAQVMSPISLEQTSESEFTWGRLALTDRELIVGDSKGSVHVYPFGSEGAPTVSLDHPEAITALAVSRDGGFLAVGTGYLHSDIWLWDVQTGKSLGQLEGHAHWVSALEFSSDGERLISASTDQTARVWDLTDNEFAQLSLIRGNEGELYTVALADDRILATGSKDGWIRFFDLEQQAARSNHMQYSLFELPFGRHERRMGASFFSFSPTENRLVAISSNEKAVLIDTTTLAKVQDMDVLGTQLRGIVYYPDGRRVLATDVDGNMIVYDLTTDQIIQRKNTGLLEEGLCLMPMRISANGILATTTGRKIEFWSAESLERLNTFGRPAYSGRELGPIEQFAWGSGSDGGVVVTCERLSETTAEMVDGNEFVTAARRAVFNLTFTEDERYLAASHFSGEITIWDLRSPGDPQLFRSNMRSVTDLAFFPSHDRMVTLGSGVEFMKVWDLESKQELIEFEVDEWGNQVEVSSDGNTIAVASVLNDQGKLRLWRAPTFEELERGPTVRYALNLESYWEERLSSAESRVKSFEGVALSPIEAGLQKQALHHLETVLTNSGRPQADVQAVKQAIFAAPPRDPSLDAKLIDLSDYYNASLYDGRGWHGWYSRPEYDRRNSMAGLPLEYDPSTVAFDLRGVVQLEWAYRDRSRTFPDQVLGISIDQKADAIHFLMSTLRARQMLQPGENEAASLVVHYVDGTVEQASVIYGRDVQFIAVGEASVTEEENELSEEVIAWRGRNDLGVPLTLSKFTWRNSAPDKSISHIDFLSGKAKAAPFLVAITLE